MSTTSTKPPESNKGASQSSINSLNSSIIPSGPQNVYEFKIIMLGDQAVGKTSLINRFIKNEFKSVYHCTLGVDFNIKSLRMDETTSANLKIWDTAGEEKYRTMTRQYYTSAKGIFLVYDLTNKGTFDRLDSWVTDIKNACPEEVVIFIVGNKSDVNERKMYLVDEARKYAKNNNYEYMEVSAKSGKNVVPMFEVMTKKLIQAENNLMKNKKTSSEPLGKTTLISGSKNIEVIHEKKDKCC